MRNLVWVLALCAGQVWAETDCENVALLASNYNPGSDGNERLFSGESDHTKIMAIYVSGLLAERRARGEYGAAYAICRQIETGNWQVLE